MAVSGEGRILQLDHVLHHGEIRQNIDIGGRDRDLHPKQAEIGAWMRLPT